MLLLIIYNVSGNFGRAFAICLFNAVRAPCALREMWVGSASNNIPGAGAFGPGSEKRRILLNVLPNERDIEIFMWMLSIKGLVVGSMGAW